MNVRENFRIFHEKHVKSFFCLFLLNSYPNTRITDPSMQFINAKYEHDLDSDATIMLRAGYGSYIYRGVYDYGAFIDHENDDGRWWTTEATMTRRIGDRHRVVFGVEDQYNSKQRQQGIGQFGSFLDKDSTLNRWAIYLQDEIRWSEQLILNLGVRHDRYESFGGTTNPRVALIHLRGADTIKLLYGTSFRAPNVFEMFYTDGVSQKTNPALKSETIRTYELVWEHALNPNLRGLVTGFNYKIDRLITFGADPTDELFVFENADAVSAYGLEMELEGHLLGQVEGRISYAFQKSKNEQTSQDLSNSPRHLVKANFNMPLVGDQLYAGVETQLTSQRLTKDGSYEKENAVTNVSLFARRWVKHLEVSASIYNVFGSVYADPAADIYIQNVIPMDGRVYRVKAKYEF